MSINQTKDVYEFIFKDQIENNTYLTKDKIEQLGNPETTFGNKLIEEEQLLYFLQEENDGVDENGMKCIRYDVKFFMYPSELELFSLFYDFVRFNKFPIFIKHPN